MTKVSTNATHRHPIVLIQIWVADRSIDQALVRRQAVHERMTRVLVNHIGADFGWVFNNLGRERTGKNPLASEGDCIAGSAYHFRMPDVSPEELAALTREMVEDFSTALGFPVAVDVEVIPVDEDADSDGDLESVPDPGATMSVTITVREHATILAALRYVAWHGGFRYSMEADIAANGGQWDMMGVDEIDALGDCLNVGSDPVRNVCL